MSTVFDSTIIRGIKTVCVHAVGNYLDLISGKSHAAGHPVRQWFGYRRNLMGFRPEIPLHRQISGSFFHYAVFAVNEQRGACHLRGGYAFHQRSPRVRVENVDSFPPQKPCESERQRWIVAPMPSGNQYVNAAPVHAGFKSTPARKTHIDGEKCSGVNLLQRFTTPFSNPPVSKLNTACMTRSGSPFTMSLRLEIWR